MVNSSYRLYAGSNEGVLLMGTGERILLFELLGFYDKTPGELLREPYDKPPVKVLRTKAGKHNRVVKI